jgi:hypothetical protein
MGIKRKHFDDASPTSMSSFGAVSTPDAQSPTRFPQGLDGTADMDMDIEPTHRTNIWDFSRAQRTKSSDWGLRTRKRVRDNRPDERAIHGMCLPPTASFGHTLLISGDILPDAQTNREPENTVHKLFLAQRQNPHASPDPVPTTQPALTVTKPQKSTLHSFWNIAAPPVQTPLFSYQTPLSQAGGAGPRCEDCDARLGVEEAGMDIDMDVDGMGDEGTFSCSECGRNVCGTCAVVGDVRRCLQCATHGY